MLLVTLTIALSGCVSTLGRVDGPELQKLRARCGEVHMRVKREKIESRDLQVRLPSARENHWIDVCEPKLIDGRLMEAWLLDPDGEAHIREYNHGNTTALWGIGAALGVVAVMVGSIAILIATMGLHG